MRSSSLLIKVSTERIGSRESTAIYIQGDVMRRCNYDEIYRVFSVAILTVAFTFTVILTNVFVDIEGLLNNKEKDEHHIGNETEGNKDTNEAYQYDNTQGQEYNDFLKEEVDGINELDKNGKEDNKKNKVVNQPKDIILPEKYDDYRTKRSIAPNMILKMIIDIKSLNQKNKSSNSSGSVNTENIKGLVKLIYNGKPMNFSEIDEEELENKRYYENTDDKQIVQEDANLSNEVNMMGNFINRALTQHLKKYLQSERFKAQRPKQIVKVHKGKIGKSTQKKEQEKVKHKNIIVNIQKTLRTNDTAQINAETKSINLLKKRLVNPLKNGNKTKIIIAVKDIVRRQIDPISETVKAGQYLPKFYDHAGEERKKTFTKYNFYSDSVSVNSGEMDKFNLDNNKERLQQPLDSDNVRRLAAEKREYSNVDGLKFFIVDGTGLSTGLDQYVGKIPDTESFKTFTKLQQLINIYNQNNNVIESNSDDNYSPDSGHEILKRDISTVGELESIFSNNQATDPNFKSFKLKVGDIYLPYDSYSKTIDDGHKKVSISIEKELATNQYKDNETVKPEMDDDNKQSDTDHNDMPFLVDESILKKPLTPSEILSLANLLNRKKRSPPVTIKRYSKLKTRGKPHINRYLKRNKRLKMVRKIWNKNQRNKRQVNKIRIVATDGIPRLSRNSEENVYLVTGENILADTVVLGGINAPEQEQPENVEHNDSLVGPHHIITNQSPNHNIFGTRSRHNALMAKYPHLYLKEIMRPNEEQDNPVYYTNLRDNYEEHQKNLGFATPSSIVTPFETKKAEVLYPTANYYDSTDHRPGHKLTITIRNNQPNAPTNFKSVHTSINKTIDGNGLLYISQTKISELFNVDNILNENVRSLDKTNILEENRRDLSEQLSKQISDISRSQQSTQDTMYLNSATYPLVEHIKEQQEKMKLLLKQHKQHLDIQLDNLKQEKQHLDGMIVHRCADESTKTASEVKKPHLLQMLLPSNSPQTPHLDQQQAGPLITSAIIKLHRVPDVNDVSNQIYLQQVVTTTTFTTTPATTTQTMTTTQAPTMTTSTSNFEDPEKTKMMHTIQKNEILTNVLINKIDRNTNMLQHFLQKLTDRLELVTRQPDPLTSEMTKSPPSKELKPEPFFSQLGMNQNTTHVSIPFVYAYQQPGSANSPVASVVFQGHIHTNTFNNPFSRNTEKDKYPNKRDTKKTLNLDDLERPRLKPVPAPMRKEPYNIPRIKNNIIPTPALVSKEHQQYQQLEHSTHAPGSTSGLANAVQNIVLRGNAAARDLDSSLSHLLQHPLLEMR